MKDIPLPNVKNSADILPNKTPITGEIIFLNKQPFELSGKCPKGMEQI